MKNLMMLLLLACVAEASGRQDLRNSFTGAEGYGYVLTAPISGVFGRSPQGLVKSNQLIDEYMAERRLNLEMEVPGGDGVRLTDRVEKPARARKQHRRRPR